MEIEADADQFIRIFMHTDGFQKSRAMRDTFTLSTVM